MKASPTVKQCWITAVFLLIASPTCFAAHDFSGAYLHPNIPTARIIEAEPPQTHTFPALDTNNAFTGNNTHSGTETFTGTLNANGPTNLKTQNAIQFADQYSTTGAVAVPVNAPAIFQATSGGTVAANNYKCEVTFVGATSGETTASPASASVTTTGATSLLTCSHAEIPPPAGALTYNVYWQTAGAGSFFQGHTGVALGVADSQTTTPPTSGSTPPGSNTALAVLPTVQTALAGAGTMVVPSTISSSAGAAGAPTTGETFLDWRNSAIFANPLNSLGASIITGPGTFNNTQQLYQSVSINKFNQRAELNLVFSPTAFALEGVSSGVVVPASSTTGQVNGIAGYVVDQRVSPTTPSVGVFGVGNAQALNARVWGANFVGTDVGSASASNSIYAGENDCFLQIVGSVCRGLLLEAFWLGGIQPTAVYGIEVGQPQGSVANPSWTYGMRFDLGATKAATGNNAALFFDRVATGVSQRSQGIELESTNSGGGNPVGILDMDPNGNLQYVSNVGGTGFTVGLAGTNTGQVALNGVTAGTVTHTVPASITSYSETDPAAAPTVAGAVKTFTTGGVASFSTSPGTLTVANGTATMTTAAITAGNCGTTVTVSASGVATTDTITWAFNAAPAGSNAGIVAWPTANNVNFAYCPNSAETPAAATINWRVVR